jgi:hypothetical protein
MPGVPRQLIEHSLSVDPKATPKRQHLRCFADDRRDAIKKELAKLLTAGFIREVFHPEWLANPVLVRKKNSNEWRMCVDYTDLNKHCPKDPIGLPRIDQSSTTRRAATCSASSTATPGTTRSLSRKKTRRHHLVLRILLHDHVLRVEERRRYLPASYPGLLQEAAQLERRSLCG